MAQGALNTDRAGHGEVRGGELAVFAIQQITHGFSAGRVEFAVGLAF